MAIDPLAAQGVFTLNDSSANQSAPRAPQPPPPPPPPPPLLKQGQAPFQGQVPPPAKQQQQSKPPAVVQQQQQQPPRQQVPKMDQAQVRAQAQPRTPIDLGAFQQQSQMDWGLNQSLGVSDFRAEQMSEEEAREYLSEYAIYRLEKRRDDDRVGLDRGGSPWEFARKVEVKDLPKEDAAAYIRQREEEGVSVVEEKASFPFELQEQVERTHVSLSKQESEPAIFHWVLAGLYSKKQRIEKYHGTRSYWGESKQFSSARRSKGGSSRGGGSRAKKERVSVTMFFKRVPRPTVSALVLLEQRRRSAASMQKRAITAQQIQDNELAEQLHQAQQQALQRQVEAQQRIRAIEAGIQQQQQQKENQQLLQQELAAQGKTRQQATRPRAYSGSADPGPPRSSRESIGSEDDESYCDTADSSTQDPPTVRRRNAFSLPEYTPAATVLVQTPQSRLLVPTTRVNTDGDTDGAAEGHMSPGDVSHNSSSPLTVADSGYGSMASAFKGAQNMMAPSMGAQQDEVQGHGEPAMDLVSEQPSRPSSPALSSAGSLAGQIPEYVSAFVQEILPLLASEEVREVVDTAAEHFHELLRQFAIRLSYEGNDQTCRNIAWTAYYHRAKILGDLRHQIGLRDDNDEDAAENQPDDDNLDFRLSLLTRQFGTDCTGSRDEYFDPEPIEIELHRQELLDSYAFVWLIEEMRRPLHVQTEIPSGKSVHREVRSSTFDDLQQLGQDVLVNKHEISRHRRPISWAVQLQVDWNPREFLSSATVFHHGSVAQLDSILVVTGSEKFPQACTVSDYVSQTWPQIGPEILSYISPLAKGLQDETSCTLRDGTSLAMKVEDTLVIKAVGTSYGIAVVAEVIAWMGSAMQSVAELPGQSTVYTTTAQLDRPQLEPGWTNAASRKFSNDEPLPQVHYRLRFSAQGAVSEDSPGNCWHPLFQQVVIARGFPIRRRKHQNPPGLEISFDGMTQLIQADWITEVEGTLILRSCSMLFYVSEITDDTIVWHYISTPDSRISLMDERLPTKGICGKGKDLEGLLARIKAGRSRHIVGWCPKVHQYTGTSHANYDVRSSDQTAPLASVRFEKFQFGFSGPVTAIAEFDVARNAKPVFALRSESYGTNLKSLAKAFVLIYDTDTRVAWLVNGPSALLHVVRASLKFDFEDPWSDGMPYQKIELVESPDSLNDATDAIKVLTNPKNLSQVVFSIGGEEEETFHDRVKSIFHVLAEIIDRSGRSSASDRQCLETKILPGATDLEGFEFCQVARQDRQCPPLSHAFLQPPEWIKLVKLVGPGVLFGKGFGELIQPALDPSPVTQSPCCDRCSWNAPVPKGKDMLVVSEQIFHWILRSKGVEGSDSVWKLPQGITWDERTRHQAFQPCSCTPKGGICRRFQRLSPHSAQPSSKLPRLSSLFKDKKSVKSLPSPGTPAAIMASTPWAKSGALIFGHAYLQKHPNESVKPDLASNSPQGSGHSSTASGSDAGGSGTSQSQSLGSPSASQSTAPSSTSGGTGK